MIKNIDLSNNVIENKTKNYAPSKIQANTLFTFMPELVFLLKIIKNKKIAPRYCEENIKYLKIKNIDTVSFPMKCFCDINLHKINNHLEWFGYYGIGLTKEWGIENKLQPLIYINSNNDLRKDFTTVFNRALSTIDEKTSKNEELFGNYILHQLMYYKPCYGKFRNRVTNTEKRKCFTDENEWRYVPNISNIEDVEQIYINKDHKPLIDLSNAIESDDTICLKFDVNDVKYIIVKTKEDYEIIINTINQIDDYDQISKLKLISKVLVWDLCGGDF